MGKKNQPLFSTQSKKVLILTTAQFGTRFPENFSAWCAGALTATGCSVRILKLETLTPDCFGSMRSKTGTFRQMETVLHATDLVSFVLPTYNNMFPTGLEHLIQHMPFRDRAILYLLIAIAMEPYVASTQRDPYSDHFRLSKEKLREMLHPGLEGGSMQITPSADGSMCPLFQEANAQLNALLGQMLHLPSKASTP